MRTTCLDRFAFSAIHFYYTKTSAWPSYEWTTCLDRSAFSAIHFYYTKTSIWSSYESILWYKSTTWSIKSITFNVDVNRVDSLYELSHKRHTLLLSLRYHIPHRSHQLLGLIDWKPPFWRVFFFWDGLTYFFCEMSQLWSYL